MIAHFHFHCIFHTQHNIDRESESEKCTRVGCCNQPHECSKLVQSQVCWPTNSFLCCIFFSSSHVQLFFISLSPSAHSTYLVFRTVQQRYLYITLCARNDLRIASRTQNCKQQWQCNQWVGWNECDVILDGEVNWRPIDQRRGRKNENSSKIALFLSDWLSISSIRFRTQHKTQQWQRWQQSRNMTKYQITMAPTLNQKIVMTCVYHLNFISSLFGITVIYCTETYHKLSALNFVIKEDREKKWKVSSEFNWTIFSVRPTTEKWHGEAEEK